MRSAAQQWFWRGWLLGLAVCGLLVLAACGTAGTRDPAQLVYSQLMGGVGRAQEQHFREERRWAQ